MVEGDVLDYIISQADSSYILARGVNLFIGMMPERHPTLASCIQTLSDTPIIEDYHLALLHIYTVSKDYSLADDLNKAIQDILEARRGISDTFTVSGNVITAYNGENEIREHVFELRFSIRYYV